MKTPKVSSYQYSNNTANNKGHKKDITFGYIEVVEGGGSVGRVSLKGSLLKNNGEKLFGIDGFLKETPEAFKNNEDFLTKVAESLDTESFLKRRKAEVNAQLESNNLSEEEKEALEYKRDKLDNKIKIFKKEVLQNKKERELKGLALLLPGTVQDDKAEYLPNIKRVKTAEEMLVDSSEKTTRLTDVDLPKVIQIAREQGNVEIAKKVKFIAAKDLAGTGFGVFEKIAKHPSYRHYIKDGLIMTVIHPGGGYGAVDVKVKGDLVNIETNEIGHAYHHNVLTGKQERLGGMGASVPKVLSNFAEQIGITTKEGIDAIKATGLGQLATETQIHLNNVTCAKAIDLLLETGIYENGGKGPDNTLLKVRPEAKEKFYKASKYVLDSYANNLAVAAISKIAESSNLIVLSGPMTMGMNRTIQANPEIYGAKNLRDLTFQFIEKNAKGDATIEDNIKTYGFDIICDQDVSIKNNTRGGEMLLKDHVITHPNRGQWIEVPLKVFTQEGDKTFLAKAKCLVTDFAKKVPETLKKLAKRIKK